MKSKVPGARRVGGRFTMWFAYNPSGVPRRQAIRIALAGVGLGVVGGLFAYEVAGRGDTESLWRHGLSMVAASMSGAIIAPLGVLLLARLLDRVISGDDHLIGYSGLMRMLLHAGELSFLGALGSGIGAGVGGVRMGLLSGMLVAALLGAVLYRGRGLGLVVGLTVGVLTGAISGAIGGMIGRWIG